jgi:hypothetical protein
MRRRKEADVGERGNVSIRSGGETEKEEVN